MPSIEIVAVGQHHAASFDDLPFAVEADAQLESHRSPSRFQQDFDGLSGVLYHLGNPELKRNPENRIFLAYQLLSYASQDGAGFFEFASEYRPAFERFLALLMSDSPSHRLVFTSDWQFGPPWTKREPALSLPEFWMAHDAGKLSLNARYPIWGSRPIV